MDCLFCKIINNEIPSYTVYEDEFVKAFLDIKPSCNGDILIVPKKHFLDIRDVDNEYLISVIEVARKLSYLVEEKLGVEGYTLEQNNGKAKLMNHFHIHLKPYYEEKQELKPVEEIYNILASK